MPGLRYTIMAEEQEEMWLPDVIDSWTFDDHEDIFSMMMDEYESIDASNSNGLLALGPPPTTPRPDGCQTNSSKSTASPSNCRKSVSPLKQDASKLREKADALDKENEQFVLRPFQLWRILLLDPDINDEKKAVKALQEVIIVYFNI